MFEKEIHNIEKTIFKDYADYEAIIDSLDGILFQESDNKRALELKYFAAFAAEHYELCINTCDSVIELDNKNIDALLFKANSLFRLEQYPECINISNYVLNIDHENKDALDLIENSNAIQALNELETMDTTHVKEESEDLFPSDYKPVNKSLKRKIIEWVIIFIIFALPLLLIYYYHPLRESMSCNKAFKCKLSQTFYGNYTKIRILTLSNQLYFARRTSVALGKDSTRYNSYPLYKLSNGRKFTPFIYYIYQSGNKSRNDTYMDIEYKKFSNYVANPRRGYSIRSKAYPKSINTPFIGYLVYIIVLFVLEHLLKIGYSILSSLRLKRKKRKKKSKTTTKNKTKNKNKGKKSEKKIENDIVDMMIDKIPEASENATENKSSEDLVTNGNGDGDEVIYQNSDDDET